MNELIVPWLVWHLHLQYGRLSGVTSTGHRLRFAAVVTYLILSMNDGGGVSRVRSPCLFFSFRSLNILCFAIILSFAYLAAHSTD
ncbi:hypothetical protein BDN71DRAFT_860217 [Pleurotus eryngii]|uniref:Uncharacterized protein n=1 Tax=Pleurotus eryngii TaxID=5323 RepID=A0A9P6A0F7_PLEER|nr:hypothetical protein BDN71DRAFT_860217 [Pleurotus eryngii]